MPLLWKNILGVFVIESEEVVDKSLFTKDPEEVAEKLVEETQEEKEFEESYDSLKEGSGDLTIERLSREFGLFEGRKDLLEFERKVAIEFSKKSIEESQGKDKELIEAVRALDEIKDTKNTLKERLSSWASLYIDNTEKGNLISRLREESELESEKVRDFAQLMEEIERNEEGLEDYIESLSRKVAPNLSELLGALLNARVLALAGSLEKLAKMPSSTVQVLGAEKALFRYMRGEGSAPKHGVIFLHPCVNQAPNDKRGKIARFLANKVSIAARLDFYGEKTRGEKLRKELEDKFEEVKS